MVSPFFSQYCEEQKPPKCKHLPILWLSSLPKDTRRHCLKTPDVYMRWCNDISALFSLSFEFRWYIKKHFVQPRDLSIPSPTLCRRATLAGPIILIGIAVIANGVRYPGGGNITIHNHVASRTWTSVYGGSIDGTISDFSLQITGYVGICGICIWDQNVRSIERVCSGSNSWLHQFHWIGSVDFQLDVMLIKSINNNRGTIWCLHWYLG